jgi:flagellar basal body-associated protein FliL
MSRTGIIVICIVAVLILLACVLIAYTQPLGGTR